MIRSAEWATPAERMRFRWEAEAIAALDHPNIVPIYEIGEVASEDGAQLPFFSMKLIEGENLAQCRERFRNDWNAIARLMILIARAVDHAHQRGILHRDLKPANILLACSAETSGKDELAPGTSVMSGTTRLTPHISDFGLAAKAQQQRGQNRGRNRHCTPAYLAPELASGQTVATNRIRCLRVPSVPSFTSCWSGNRLFRADTAMETIRLLNTSSVKSPRQRQSCNTSRLGNDLLEVLSNATLTGVMNRRANSPMTWSYSLRAGQSVPAPWEASQRFAVGAFGNR